MVVHGWDEAQAINANLTINNSTSFKYKLSVTGITETHGENGKVTNTKIALPIKYCAYCFGQNPGARGEHLTIQTLWATARLLVTRFIVLST